MHIFCQIQILIYTFNIPSRTTINHILYWQFLFILLIILPFLSWCVSMLWWLYENYTSNIICLSLSTTYKKIRFIYHVEIGYKYFFSILRSYSSEAHGWNCINYTSLNQSFYCIMNKYILKCSLNGKYQWNI